MSEVCTLRFESYEYYDICEDVVKTRVTAISNIGTWHTDIRSDERHALVNGNLELRSKAFRTFVLQAAALNQAPCEVIFGD